MSDDENNNQDDPKGVNTSVFSAPERKEADTTDLSQAEQILFYQDAPVKGPAWLQDAAQSRANFAQRLAGTSEWTIGNGVGSLSQLTREELAEKKQQEAAEWFDDMFEAVERAREEERQREEWSQAKHAYAGMEMTGEEWGEFADQLKGDTPLRKWLLEKLKKEGKTDAKANEMADQMALLAKMQNLPPNQWTDDMKALNTKLAADPALRVELDKNLRDAKKFEADFELSGRKVEQVADTAEDGITKSTVAGADILSQNSGPALAAAPNTFASTVDGPAIASALDLMDHHKAALAAKEPLDAPKQIAAFTPPQKPAPSSPGGGFDA